MNIGKMNKRITIQTATDAQDSFNSATETWADTVTLWGNINPLSGKEYNANAQTESETTHVITVRYKSGITTKNRIKYGSRYFDIENVININESNQWLEMMCTERTPYAGN